MVFVESEEAARAAAMPLRSGLWGDHKVSVLLPHGEEPIQVCLGTLPLAIHGDHVTKFMAPHPTSLSCTPKTHLWGR